MTTALVMAGGPSKRMRAEGNPQHKALRRVAGRRLIDWNVDALRHFGFGHIRVAVNAAEHELIDYLRTCGGLELLIETHPLGTIGAVRRLPASNDDVVVVNADNLTNLDLQKFVRFHVSARAPMTIATHEEPIQIPFGKLEINGERVVAYEEKPHVPVRISSGVYALNRRAIEMIEPDQRVDVPDLVTKLLAHGESVAAWAHSAQWVDVNNERARARAEYLMSENDAVAGVELPKEARG